ncbi:hypothetical protein D3C77_602390 [compost metagenome]
MGVVIGICQITAKSISNRQPRVTCTRPVSTQLEKTPDRISIPRKDRKVRIVENVIRTTLIHCGKRRQLHQKRDQAVRLIPLRRVRHCRSQTRMSNGLATHYTFDGGWGPVIKSEVEQPLAVLQLLQQIGQRGRGIDRRSLHAKEVISETA